MNLDQFKTQHPQYKNVPDGKLADALYQKFYSSMPREQFNAKIGLTSATEAAPKETTEPLEMHVGNAGYTGELQEGIPIVGPLMQRGEAAVGAAIAPMLGLDTDKSFGERYNALLDESRKSEKAFREKHPIGSLAAQTMGGAMVLPAAAETEIGARALGLVGRNVTSRMAQGAAGGAAIGATDAKLRGENPYVGGAVYGALTGLAPGIGPAMTAAGRGIRYLAQPFSATARESRAADILARAAEGGPTTVEASPVAGVEPTLAQATGNPGVAQLERTLRNRGAPIATAFTDRDVANAAAREQHWHALAGDDLSREAAKTARDAVGDAARDAAFAGKQPVAAQPVVHVVDSILASPAGQRDAVRSALGSVRAKLVLPNPLQDRIAAASKLLTPKATQGASATKQAAYKEARSLLRGAKAGAIDEKTLVSGLSKLSVAQKTVGLLDNALALIKQGATKTESDAEQLYGVRQHIGDLINPKDNSPSRLAATELIQVRNALDRAIEKGAPGYKKYLADFAKASRPINVQEGLQKARVTDANGKITLGKVDNLIKTTERLRRAPGKNWAKSLTDDEMAHLYALRTDLRMADRSSLGKAIGSNTVQNLLAEKPLASTALRRHLANIALGGAAGYGIGSRQGQPGVGALAGALAAEGYGHALSKADEDVLARLAAKTLGGAGRVALTRAQRLIRLKNLLRRIPAGAIAANGLVQVAPSLSAVSPSAKGF